MWARLLKFGYKFLVTLLVFIEWNNICLPKLYENQIDFSYVFLDQFDLSYRNFSRYVVVRGVQKFEVVWLLNKIEERSEKLFLEFFQLCFFRYFFTYYHDFSI